MARPGKPFISTGRPVSEDFKSGIQARVYFKFTPTRTRIDNIHHMRAKMMVNLARAAHEAAEELEAQIKGFVSWEDHPDRHPSDHYPSAETAYEGIFATMEQSGDMFSLVAGHGAGTISEDNQGTQYTYGGILESGKYGEQHAVIHHAWEGYAGEDSFQERFVALMTGGILVGYRANNGD